MPAPDRVDAFARAIRRLGVLFTTIAGRRGAAHGTLSKQDLLAVGVMGLGGRTRMGDIANGLGISQSAVTPVVDRLEGHGLARRARSETDRRVWLVELTEAGVDVFQDDDAIYREAAAAMMTPLTEAEQVTLVGLLKKMTGDGDDPA